MDTVIYTKYNKLRRPEFRISTMICEDENGKKSVVKKALTKEAESQIKIIYDNSLDIGKAYKKLEILLPDYRTDRVVFEFIKGENLEHSFVELLDDFETLVEKIKEGLDIITDICSEYMADFTVTKKYGKVFGDAFPEEGGAASTYINIDVLFDNVIIKDGKYICLDCEWVFDFPVPIKFVKYRCLFYFFQKYEAYLKKETDLERFLEIFGITPLEKAVFMEMERNFQMYVTGKDFENDYVYKYEKDCLALDEAFVDRKGAEQKIAELEAMLQTSVAGIKEELKNCRQELEGKYAHVRHLEAIVVEKSHEVDRLNHELVLKEQHVKNLTDDLASIRSSKWFKAQNKLTSIKKDLHRK